MPGGPAHSLGSRTEILGKIIEHIPLMINFTDSNGRIKLVNREWERVLGWSTEEILSEKIDIFAECYPDPDYRREVLKFVEAAQSKWGDFRPRARNGRIIDTTWYTVKLSDGTRIGIGQDVTGRKLEEQARRESELRFRQLAENIREVFWMADGKTREVLYVSPAYEEVWGRTCASLYEQPRSFLDSVHPGDRARVVEANERQFTAQMPYEQEYRVVRADGSVRWVRDRGFSIRDDAGQVYRFAGIAEDITAIREVAARADWLSSFPELSPSPIVETDVEGRITYANASACQLLPWLSSYARGERTDVPEHSWLAGLREMPGDIADTVTKPFERRFELDGRWYQQAIYFVAPFGRVRSYGVDITDRKRAEDELLNSVTQMRALAAREQTVREQERQSVSREIHDELGQALTAIRLELSAWMGDLPPGQQRSPRAASLMSLIDETIQSVRRIATSLRPGILDDAGLTPAVEWAVEEFASRAGIKYRLDLPSDDLRLDPELSTALFRILQEALTNVARHANATELTVRISMETGSVRLEIHDNGQGITGAQLSHSASVGILGMQERARLLGGELIVRGSPGKGTTVTVRIPESRSGEPSD
jgi:PAS domain S-box-containing protein